MIEVRGLTRLYGGRPAIAGLTFSVPAGQVAAILGPRRAGKSTVMRILAGCLAPTDGTASVAGYDVAERSREVRRRVGYLPGAVSLDRDLRVGAHLETMCRVRGVPPRSRRAHIDAALAACGLDGRRRDFIGALAGPERQRVGLAAAVVHDPEVLVLDEPVAGLGAGEAGEACDLLAGLGRGRTVVLSSRDLAEASALCDRVLILRDGSLAADDTPADLSRRLAHRRSREVVAVVRGAAAAAQRPLRRLPGVVRVEVAEVGDGEHRLTVTGDGDALQDAVARVIVQRGLELRELSSREPPVEDLFRDLVPEAVS